MPKLYTKTGDKGTTCLYDMRKVPKGDKIMDFLGDSDELSAHIGYLITKIINQKYIDKLRIIQNDLLDIGSNIATSTLAKRKTFISTEDVKKVEEWIDEMEEKNTPLKEFILPGVDEADSQAHICRAVCRRVERKLVNLHFDEELNKEFQYVSDEILQYVNRLSDFFFAFARFASGCQEITRSQISSR